MIQRIQTVYLFLSSVALFLLFVFPIVTIFENGSAKKIAVTGISQSVSNGSYESFTNVMPPQFIFLTIATVILGLIPLVIISLFRNRKKQLLFIYLDILMVIGFSFWLSHTVKNTTTAAIQFSDYGIGAGLSSVAILFLVLAGKGVQRDEKLIKSADRLR